MGLEGVQADGVVLAVPFQDAQGQVGDGGGGQGPGEVGGEHLLEADGHGDLRWRDTGLTDDRAIIAPAGPRRNGGGGRETVTGTNFPQVPNLREGTGTSGRGKPSAPTAPSPSFVPLCVFASSVVPSLVPSP